LPLHIRDMEIVNRPLIHNLQGISVAYDWLKLEFFVLFCFFS
jgi:hypothetical protein